MRIDFLFSFRIRIHVPGYQSGAKKRKELQKAADSLAVT